MKKKELLKQSKKLAAVISAVAIIDAPVVVYAANEVATEDTTDDCTETESSAEVETPSEETTETESPTEGELPAEETTETESPTEGKLLAEETTETESPTEGKLPAEETTETESSTEGKLPAEETTETELPTDAEISSEEENQGDESLSENETIIVGGISEITPTPIEEVAPSPTPIEQDGWVQEGDDWYYYQNGEKITDSEVSYYDEDGNLVTGRVDQDGKKWLMRGMKMSTVINFTTIAKVCKQTA